MITTGASAGRDVALTRPLDLLPLGVCKTDTDGFDTIGRSFRAVLVGHPSLPLVGVHAAPGDGTALYTRLNSQPQVNSVGLRARAEVTDLPVAIEPRLSSQE